MNEYIDENTFCEVNFGKGRTQMPAYLCDISQTKCGVSIGTCRVNGIDILAIIFDPSYKKGALGVMEGEKITLAFEYATKRKLMIVSFVASSGIRVCEGTIALMQMAKMAAAIKLHGDKRLLYISVITQFAFGGISASVVSLADIVIAKETAIYGFTGRRIIEKTMHVSLPNNFQTAKYAQQCGMIDIIVADKEIKGIIAKLLEMHMS